MEFVDGETLENPIKRSGRVEVKLALEIATQVAAGCSVHAVAVTPDGQHVISGSRDHMLRVWDLESGQSLRALQDHTEGVTAAVLLPDGRRALLTSDYHSLQLWDLESGQSLRMLQGHTDWVTALAVTPDGRRAISGSGDRTLRVWEKLHVESHGT